MKLKLDEDVFEEADSVIPWHDMNSEDQQPIYKADYEFADNLFSFLQSLIDNDTALNEQFVSENALKVHYREHCLGNNTNRKSSKTRVYYDFRNIDKFRVYEDAVNDVIVNSQMRVSTLLDEEKIQQYIRKMFEGGKGILFGLGCDFRNDKGPVKLGLYAFSTDKTQNYTKGNTVSILTIAPNNDTISMYPVDAHYLETKFNNLIKTYNIHKDIEIHFNND